MTHTMAGPGAWRPDRRFLKQHLFWPLAVCVPLLAWVEWSGVDLSLGQAWFDWKGGQWSLRTHWLTSGLIHEGGRILVLAIGLSLLALWAGTYFRANLRPWRRTLAYLLVGILTVTGMVAGIKHLSGIPCPWSLENFGGALTYRQNHLHFMRSGEGGNCFPAGHASGGYALLAFYFAALGRVRRPGRWLLPGLCLGLVFGLGQQARGAHFLSHDLWTLAICWFGTLAVFLLMKPYPVAEVAA